MVDSIFRFIIGTAGLIAGHIIGGPFGAAVGAALGFGVANLLFPPDDQVLEGNRLDDLSVSFSTYGNPIVLLDGTIEMGGNFVWSTGLIEHRVEEELGGGGFLSFLSPTVTRVTFLYTSNWRIQYCEGVAEAILKMWADHKVVADATTPDPVGMFGFQLSGTGAQAPQSDTGRAIIRNFFGDEDQLPGPAEQADKGAANVSAYRGQVGQECENIPLLNFGNRIPNWSALVAMVATDSKPYRRITPPDNIITQLAYRSVDPRIVYVNLSALSNKIDLASMTVVDSISYTAGGGKRIALDDYNRFWSYTGLPLDDVEFQLYDADTGALIGVSDPPGTEWLDGLHAKILIPLNGGRSGAVAVGHTGRMIQLSAPSTITGGITHIRDHNSADPFELSVYFPGSYPLSGPTGYWTHDGNGDPWFTITDGSDGTIVRVDRTTGTPLQQIVLTGTGVSKITYYAERNSFILSGGPGIIRYNLDTMAIDGTISVTLSPAGRNDMAWVVLDGKMYLQKFLTGNGAIFDVGSDTMSEGAVFRPNDWVGGTSNMEAYLYDPINHAIIVTGTSGAETGKYLWLFLDRAVGNDASWRAVIERYSNKVDLAPGVDVDATAMTDTMPAYVTRKRSNARRALESGARAFGTRMVESDFLAKFLNGGVAPSFAISEDDMGATAGDTPVTDPLELTSLGEQRFFETATINFVDPDFDYQPNTQSYKRRREAITVRGSTEFSFPGALHVDQAMQIIKRILLNIWSHSIRVKVPVNWDYLLVDPADVGTVTKDGVTLQFEVDTVDVGANGVIVLEGLTDVTETAVNTAVGATALGFIPQAIVLSGTTDFMVLDSVLLRAQDDGPIVYAGAGNPDPTAWPGASIRRSADGTDYSNFTSVTPSRAFGYGRTDATLGGGVPDVWDRVNTLKIWMSFGTLASDTEDNVLNGANTLLIGVPGRWEVVNFLNATLNADGSYTVDTLLRGELGSEQYIGNHVAGDRVVVVDMDTLVRVPVGLADLNQTFSYRSVTIGSSVLGPVSEQELEIIALKPRAPSHVTGSISANDWNLTAVRRTRLGGEWEDLTGFVQLGEDGENYEWDIPIPGGTRILTSTSPTVTYTSAQQVADWGDDQTELTWTVYQMSASVGRGFGTEKTVVGA